MLSSLSPKLSGPHRSMPENMVTVKEGWLKKLGGFVKNWKVRWALSFHSTPFIGVVRCSAVWCAAVRGGAVRGGAVRGMRVALLCPFP